MFRPQTSTRGAPDRVLFAILTALVSPWVRWWQRRPRWQKRVILATVLAALMLLAAASVAWAADDEGSSIPAALKFLSYEDSHDLSIFDYDLMIDRGGVSDPGKIVWAIFCDILWWCYLVGIAVCTWVIDFSLSFEWLTMVVTPAQAAEDMFQTLIAQVGLVPALLGVMALITGTWMMLGRLSSGFFELALSLVIVGVAAGALANPVALLAGDDGLLVQGRDAGLMLASGLQDDGQVDEDADPDELREDLISVVTETFVRRPHMLINTGQILPEKCEKGWDLIVGSGEDEPKALTNSALTAAPSDDDEPGQLGEVENCEEEFNDAKEVADEPGAIMLFSIALVVPSTVLVMGFAVSLALMLLIAVVYALYEAVKATIAVVIAILPSGARGALWGSLAQFIVSVVVMVFAVTFLAAYLFVIKEVFDNIGTDGKRAAGLGSFFVVDLLMLIGLVVYWKGRNRIQAMRERMAEALKRRTRTSSAGKIPAAKGSPLKAAAGQAAQVGSRAAAYRLGQNREAGSGNGRPSSTPAKLSAHSPGQPPPGALPGPGDGQGPGSGSGGNGIPPAPTPSLPPSSGPGGGSQTSLERRLKELELKQSRSPSGQRLRQATHVATFATTAAASGGSSAAAQFAVRAARQRALDEVLSNRSRSSTGAGRLPRSTSTARPSGGQR